MYAGDITRTFPVNGKFSQPQREIYELVLKHKNVRLSYLYRAIPLSKPMMKLFVLKPKD